MTSNSYHGGPQYNSGPYGQGQGQNQGQNPYPQQPQGPGMDPRQDRGNMYGSQGNGAEPNWGYGQGNPHGQGQGQPYPFRDNFNQRDGNYGGQYNFNSPALYDAGYPPPNQYNPGGYPNQSQPNQYQQGPPRDQYPPNFTQGSDGYGGQSQGPPPNSLPMAEGEGGERGLMGALAGGALGGFGGHQMGHGFIGTLGGAFAGSQLEDHFKDKKKKKEEEEQKLREQQMRDQQMQQNSSRGPDQYVRPNKKYDGNFSATAKNIRLEKGHYLHALCPNDKRTEEKERKLDLDVFLENHFGEFRWVNDGDGNAFESARNARLIDGGRVLEAELDDGSGGWKLSRMELDERIYNEDGSLIYIP